jgi:hypothetical protein
MEANRPECPACQCRVRHSDEDQFGTLVWYECNEDQCIYDPASYDWRGDLETVKGELRTFDDRFDVEAAQRRLIDYIEGLEATNASRWRDVQFLIELETQGVDSWDGYGFAKEALKERLKEER